MRKPARQELWLYLVGAAASAGLTLLAFWTVIERPFDRPATLAVIGLCAVLQIAVQLRCFLHIRLTGQTREDLHLILFSLLLLAIMVGGTIWIMGNLDSRMH